MSSAAYILFYQRRGINFEQINYEQLRNRLDTVTDSHECSSQEAQPLGQQQQQDKQLLAASAGVATSTGNLGISASAAASLDPCINQIPADSTNI